MVDLDSVGTRVVICINVVSIAGSVWLFRTLRQMGKDLWRRVFLRQMYALSISAFVFHTAFAIQYTPPDLYPSEFRDHFCKLTMIPLRFGRFACVFIESQIGMVFAAVSCGCVRCVRCMGRCVPVCFLAAVVATYISGVNQIYSVRVHACTIEHADTVDILIIGSSMGLSTLGYIFMVWCTRRHELEGTHAAGNFRRAMIYPFIFLVTFGPALLYMGKVITDPRYMWGSWMLEALNGFMNALIYTLQAKNAKRELIALGIPVGTAVSLRRGGVERGPLAAGVRGIVSAMDGTVGVIVEHEWYSIKEIEVHGIQAPAVEFAHGHSRAKRHSEMIELTNF